MSVLPDLVGADPQVVFCGQAGAASSRHREHYYETPGNSFWESLHLSGFSPRLLRPEEDHLVVELGLGLTDLVGHDRRVRLEVEELVGRLEAWRAEWVALTSKSLGHELARAFGHPRPRLGVADWTIADADVFVLPGTSGANRRADYDGRPDRLSWWQDLAQLCGRSGPDATGR